jgi:RNA recognition motif-containing protein
MPVSLYVGNLPWTVTEQRVFALFSKYCEVYDITLMRDRDTGRFRGFGFVEIRKADPADVARALNGSIFEGRQLRVNVAIPRALPAPRSQFSLQECRD